MYLCIHLTAIRLLFNVSVINGQDGTIRVLSSRQTVPLRQPQHRGLGETYSLFKNENENETKQGRNYTISAHTAIFLVATNHMAQDESLKEWLAPRLRMTHSPTSTTQRRRCMIDVFANHFISYRKHPIANLKKFLCEYVCRKSLSKDMF